MIGHTATLPLLEAFFSCCERVFRFMELEHNFSYISGLLEHKNGRRIIKPVAAMDNAPAKLPHAITLYENSQADLDISYLPANCIVEITITQNGVQRFDLLQLLAAAHRSINAAKLNQAVHHEEAMNDVLSHAAHLVKENIDCILEPTPALLQRAILAQEKMQEHKIRARFIRDLEETSRDAARAFLKKDYKRVIELLRPYEAHLDSADKNKLALAKREILKD